MLSVIKISSPETHGFWEIPVLFEDDWLLAIDKPAELQTTPEPRQSAHPALMTLIHAAVEARKPWANDRGLTFLANTHRVDCGTSGVLLLAKTKEAAAATANEFGADKPLRRYVALVKGEPSGDTFEVQAKISPHPTDPGLMKIDPRGGKKSKTEFKVLERFSRWALLSCVAYTDRPHQVRLHVRYARLGLAGDDLYRGSELLLSSIKPGYTLKPNKTERPLMNRPALHLENISMAHPVTGKDLNITAPLPKDLAVALKYLRKYGTR